MAGIGLSGLASGVDTGTIVSQLMAIERKAITRLNLRETAVQSRDTGLKDVKTRLQTLQTAANELKSPTLWAEIQEITSSAAGNVTGTRTGSITPGTYTVEVQRLATVERKAYDFTPSLAPSSITVGSKQVLLGVGATVNDAATAINAETTMSVTAAVVDGKLQLTSKTSGQPGAFTASGSGVAEDTTRRRDGVDAAYTVNGQAKTSSTNAPEDGVPGLRLALKAPTAGPVTLTIGEEKQNVAVVKEKVKAFVDAYNSVLTTIKAKTSEKKVADADTNAEAARGALFGDRGLNAIVSSLRSTITGTVAGNPLAMDQLAEMGVSVPRATGATVTDDARLGKLTFDEAKFATAMETDPAAVQRLWSGATGAEGFAGKIAAVVTANTAAADGILTKRSESAQKDIERIRDQVTTTDRRLVDKEKRLRAQFAAMEKAMGLAQTQQSWLSGQIAGLNAQRG